LPAYVTASGNTGTAQLATVSSGVITGVPVANATNPDSVYYVAGNATFSSNTTFNGTLVVKQPYNLNINTSSVTITTKQTGQPALVVGGNVVFNGGLALTTRSLTVNGLTWLGGNMTANGLIAPTSQFTVNGALMWGGTSSGIDSNSILGSSYLHVNMPTSGGQSMDSPNWDLLYVPLLSDENQTPKSIKLISTTFN